MEKKAPFHRGNSMMDAVILLSTAEYSKRPEAHGAVHFCTQNWKDFSGKDRRDPHPDLADLFGGKLLYTYGLDSVLREIGASGDLVREVRRAESIGKCMFCDSAALIESAVCARCETPYEGALPDSEQFRVEPTAEGDTVTEHFEDLQGRYHEERLLVCEECGHDKFDLEFARLCPYHEHMSARWQEA